MAAFGAIALSAGLGAVTAGGRVFWASLTVGLAYGGFGLATYAIYRESHFEGRLHRRALRAQPHRLPRLYFSRKDGRWQMLLFLAGD